jgi:hypothetical protein
MCTHDYDESSLASLFHMIRLRQGASDDGDAARKIGQIKSYITILDAGMRGLSRQRKLILVDCAAGNCYLSFLAYHRYAILKGRAIEIHCVDIDRRMMDNARLTARSLGFTEMHFHACDILKFNTVERADITYSLHACDSATDKALFLGMSLGASSIFSVACCQHSAARALRSRGLKGITRYKAFRNRLVYMVVDTMRAHLLALNGYRVDVFDFTSTRNTDKNTMLRARRTGQVANQAIQREYKALRAGFGVEPGLARLLDQEANAR